MTENPKSEFERETLAALKAIRDTLGDIRRELAALRTAHEQTGDGVQEQVVGGSVRLNDLTRNKLLPKRLA